MNVKVSYKKYPHLADGVISSAFLCPNLMKEGMYMNKKTNEKSHRIYLRVSQNEKQRITELANSCGLSVAEYLRKRALGYAVKAVVPDAFYIFNERLSELLNRELSPETEAKALKLFDDIYAEVIDTQKQSKKEIIQEVEQWQAQDSGPLSPD